MGEISLLDTVTTSNDTHLGPTTRQYSPTGVDLTQLIEVQSSRTVIGRDMNEVCTNLATSNNSRQNIHQIRHMKQLQQPWSNSSRVREDESFKSNVGEFKVIVSTSTETRNSNSSPVLLNSCTLDHGVYQCQHFKILSSREEPPPDASKLDQPDSISIVPEAECTVKLPDCLPVSLSLPVALPLQLPLVVPLPIQLPVSLSFVPPDQGSVNGAVGLADYTSFPPSQISKPNSQQLNSPENKLADWNCLQATENETNDGFKHIGSSQLSSTNASLPQNSAFLLTSYIPDNSVLESVEGNVASEAEYQNRKGVMPWLTSQMMNGNTYMPGSSVLHKYSVRI
ncbi:unnamed protein product [Protopolystoma xenopodis]|uniref:Uncharacterized protein n=1 Tax=Protopolystoma xenopodis TaxID=117903 RepID=A0A3S5ANI5_9PLAT|nr:unnamed protein product [Protopolystoma xenopodis]